jgi:hypothetical protein
LDPLRTQATKEQKINWTPPKCKISMQQRKESTRFSFGMGDIFSDCISDSLCILYVFF